MHAPPNDLDAFWMPFTPNRVFKADPVMVTGAAGVYSTTADGRSWLDAIAGLWCCNAGHRNSCIVEAITRQAAELDFVSSFGRGHPAVFRYAARLASVLPDGIEHVFFSNSGSEALDTALKIALAYHNARGEGQRTRIIGRQRGYHGMGFGGLSAAGMGPHKRQFGPLLPGAAHLPHTHDPARNAFSRGQPAHGAEYADALLDMIATYDASTIAAVIVEPVAGSTGVLVPPQSYLQRLREITAKHGILLIFDEVVTGFGRLGAPFAAQAFGVTPDLMALAKGMTNGAVPMGGTAVSAQVSCRLRRPARRNWRMASPTPGIRWRWQPPPRRRWPIEDGIWENAARRIPLWGRGDPFAARCGGIVDIRACGLLAGIEFGATPDEGHALVKTVTARCLDAGVLVRPVGNTIVLSQPLVLDASHIGGIVDALRSACG